MASSDRQSKSTLGELAQSPYRFSFFAAIRKIEQASPELPRIGTALRPADEIVRIVQRPRMDFVPSSITSIEWSSIFQKWEMDCQFFGMFGPQGALPIELTEYAMARIRDARDHTLNRFIDGFYHRMMSFYYRAMASVEPTLQYDRPNEDRVSVYLGSFAGIGSREFQNRDSMPDLAKLQFTGHLSQQNHNADGLASILNGVFQVPVRVCEFVGCWLTIPESDRLRLGNAQGGLGILGESTTIGEKVWEYQQAIRIDIGPLEWKEYREFTPLTDNLKILSDVIKNYCGIGMFWRARIALKKEDVPATQLGKESHLGWNTWLKTTEFERDPADLEISMEQLSSAKKS